MAEKEENVPSRREAGERVAGREAAAQEKRLWVRLTRACNNRCAFCLDSMSLDGGRLSSEEINAKIIDGKLAGATRLILSGGEPTLHPDFLKFVALGSTLGYRRVQTITNGRLFSYQRFLKRAVDAGLGEITFSIHGHDALVHDTLVGVAGAFDEATAGLRNALSDRRLIVNVDVCLNRMNIGGLPALLDNCIEMGVREFDLLHIIPFGRAFEESRSALFYDIEEAMPSIEYALKLSLRGDLHIWFNRFPPPYLEGYEHLIQDPHKLTDEVRGREEEYELLLSVGTALHCKEEERCRHCYLDDFCRSLDELRADLDRGRIEVLRHRLDRSGPAGPFRLPDNMETTWVLAPDLPALVSSLPKLPGSSLILELDSYRGLSDYLEDGRILGRSIRRLHVLRSEDIDSLLALDLDCEVVVYLDAQTAAHLKSRYPKAPSRLVVAGRNHALLTEAAARDADLGLFFRDWDPSVPVEGVPACISGRPPRPSPRVLDSSILRLDGRLDAFGFADRYVIDGYYTKSRRCRSCVHDATCQGAHINWVRAHGYGTLQPVRRL